MLLLVLQLYQFSVSSMFLGFTFLSLHQPELHIKKSLNTRSVLLEDFLSEISDMKKN